MKEVIARLIHLRMADDTTAPIEAQCVGDLAIHHLNRNLQISHIPSGRFVVSVLAAPHEQEIVTAKLLAGAQVLAPLFDVMPGDRVNPVATAEYQSWIDGVMPHIRAIWKDLDS